MLIGNGIDFYSDKETNAAVYIKTDITSSTDYSYIMVIGDNYYISSSNIIPAYSTKIMRDAVKSFLPTVTGTSSDKLVIKDGMMEMYYTATDVDGNFNTYCTLYKYHASGGTGVLDTTKDIEGVFFPNHNCTYVLEGNEIKKLSITEPDLDYTTQSLEKPITFNYDKIIYVKWINNSTILISDKLYKLNFEEGTKELLYTFPTNSKYNKFKCFDTGVIYPLESYNMGYTYFETESSTSRLTSLTRNNETFYNIVDGNANPEDILKGRKAYTHAGLIEGTLDLSNLDYEELGTISPTEYSADLNLTNDILGN